MRTPALPALLLLALAATAAAGRDLRGLDTSLPAAVNATTAETRGLFSESWEYLESLFEVSLVEVGGGGAVVDCGRLW